MEDEHHARYLDFAFYRVHLGMSQAEYLGYTRAQLLFIAHEWEQRRVAESTVLRNAVANAIANCFGSKSVELWPAQAPERKIEDWQKKASDIEAWLLAGEEVADG